MKTSTRHWTASGCATTDAFAELEPALTADQALAEVNRCLFCYDAPCTRACPTHIDVPKFIKKIGSGNLRGSARTIIEANVLGYSCARVCPTEVLCEGACVLNDLHGERPISIGALQRYATEPLVRASPATGQLLEPGADNGRQIAIIGAGPAGLACAAELRQRGYGVVLFEARDSPGGLNTVGVADYKMDRPAGLAEVHWLRDQLGFEIRCGVRVGDQIKVDQLLLDYQALFIAVGLGPVPPLGIPGEALPGSRDALAFIAELKMRPKVELSLAGKRVAVLGGGNTAIDAATQSARLGAECVQLLYRRGRLQMGAYDHEVELARLDGVDLVWFAQPVAILGDDRVTGVRCQRMRLDADGALQATGEMFELAADLVLRATGQGRYGFLADVPRLELDARGVVVTDSEGRTSHDRVWAAGDCANGGKEVVNAVAEGKRAAVSIDRQLSRGGVMGA